MEMNPCRIDIPYRRGGSPSGARCADSDARATGYDNRYTRLAFRWKYFADAREPLLAKYS